MVTKANNFKGTNTGELQNNLGLIKFDQKGNMSLDSKKFMELTNHNPTRLSHLTESPRQKFYEQQIPLKPSTKLFERIIQFIHASDFAFELFNKNVERTMSWMMSPNALLFGASPFEVCLRGEGKPLLQWLIERSGQKQVSNG